MTDYELTYAPKSWDEEPDDGSSYVPDDVDLEIIDGSASALDFGLALPNRDFAQRIRCIGMTTRMRGLRAEEREIGVMYERSDGRHRIKHFVMTQEQCIALANRLLELAGVEVLDG